MLAHFVNPDVIRPPPPPHPHSMLSRSPTHANTPINFNIEFGERGGSYYFQKIKLLKFVYYQPSQDSNPWRLYGSPSSLPLGYESFLQNERDFYSAINKDMDW